MFREVLISDTASIKDALKCMDNAAKKNLFVVDDLLKLKGSLTDGDIRRWILKEGSLNEKVHCVYNPSPKTVLEGHDHEHVRRLMINNKIEAVPVLNSGGSIIDVLYWDKIFGDSEPMYCKSPLSIPVFIMAGGRGSRLDPVTKIIPKPLIPLGEKPIVEHIMDYFIKHGCESFVMVVNYKGKMIQSYFDNPDLASYNVDFVWESDALGTAGGLKLAYDKIESDNLFVSNCDVLVKADYHDIYDYHTSNDNDITVVGCLRHIPVPYGVITIENGGVFNNLIEKPEYDIIVNTGFYIIKKSVLNSIPDNKFMNFTDLIDVVKKDNKKIGVYPVSQKSWTDIGQWKEYNSAAKNFE